jgi:hypothetical protein
LLASLGFVAGAACMLIPGTSAAFSASSLTGGYGCLAHVTLNDNSGTLSGISEILRLSLDGAGNAKGKIVVNIAGEVCTIATTGTYNVNFGGLGTMNLKWNTITGDADGDTNCAMQLNPLAVTQHTDFVVEAGGNIFDFQGSDDFLTSPTSAPDSGDVQSPFVGTYRKQ